VLCKDFESVLRQFSEVFDSVRRQLKVIDGSICREYLTAAIEAASTAALIAIEAIVALEAIVAFDRY